MSAPLRALVVSSLTVVAGCGGAAACPPLLPAMGSLAAQAAAVEIDVYDDSATCDGNDVAGAPQLLLTRRSDGANATTVQLPAGHYVVVLHAFDANGALIGSACEPELFSPGQHACLSVPLSDVTDGGVPGGGDDLAGADLAGTPPPGDMGKPPFVEQSSGVTTDLYEAWSPGGGVVFVVGVSGVILHSTDSGATWTKQTSGTTNTLEAVWGSSADDVFVVGTSGLVLHTTNGGAKWTQLSVPVAPSIYLYDVWGSSASDVYIVGDKGSVLHGSGTSFTSVTLPGGVSTFLNCVWGSSPSDVYLFGGMGTILHGSAGAGFVKQTSGVTDNLYYGWGSADGSDVWINAVNTNAPSGTPPMTTVLHTGDHGATWTTQISTSVNLWAIWASASGDAFAVGDQILETTDHGANWSSVVSTPTHLLIGAGGDAATGSVWAVGTAGAILYRP